MAEIILVVGFTSIGAFLTGAVIYFYRFELQDIRARRESREGGQR